VLDEDPDLGTHLPEARWAHARQASVAGVLPLAVGAWAAAIDAERARGGYGLLVLDGLLVRRVGLDGRFGAELLSTGDLLRPWESDGHAAATMSFETSWRVVAPARLAVLDLPWAARMAYHPEVGAELAGRALSRSNRLSMTMAITQQPRLDVRLWMLFWELADRYGTVRPDGVHLELPLTHELLSHLAAARRPSVSGALSKLSERGVVRREGRSWVITGEPPGRAPPP
jgi:hypothetical protein